MANAEIRMQEAAQRLFQKISAERPRDLEEINGQLMANVAVTWQKRGHLLKLELSLLSLLTQEKS